MSVTLTICDNYKHQDSNNMLWQVGTQIYILDKTEYDEDGNPINLETEYPDYYDNKYEEIDSVLTKYFKTWSDLQSLESIIKNKTEVENILGVKFIPNDPNWLRNIMSNKSSSAIFNAKNNDFFIELYLSGFDQNVTQFEMNMANGNFHHYFNTYLNMGLEFSGTRSPLDFLKALDAAPIRWFGQRETTDEIGSGGVRMISGGIDEEYLKRKDLQLEHICQEALKRKLNICWG